MAKPEPIIELNNVSLNFKILGDLEIKVFDKIELEIFSGEKIGLIGPSGSGKTSFFRLIAGLLRPTQGKIITNGNLRLIYQIPRINPYLTCEEILEIGLQLGESKSSISEILNVFDLSHFKRHLFLHLSEGQKQRISIILNLISGTEILLADEPYSRLDNENIQRIHKYLLKVIDDKDITLIMGSHHIGHFQGFDRIFEIENASLVQNKQFS